MSADPLPLDCLWVLSDAPSAAATLQASRPTDAALLLDLVVLLAIIALIYLTFRRIASHPAIPTAMALCVLFYALVNERWWNLAAIEVDTEGVTSRSWIGGVSRLAWSDIDAVTCRSGDLFPVFQDDASVVLRGTPRSDPPASSSILEIEIPRFLDRYPELALVIQERLPALATQPRPPRPAKENPDVRP